MSEDEGKKRGRPKGSKNQDKMVKEKECEHKIEELKPVEEVVVKSEPKPEVVAEPKPETPEKKVVPGKEWAEHLTDSEFTMEWGKRFLYSDTVPCREEWIYRPHPVYKSTFRGVSKVTSGRD